MSDFMTGTFGTTGKLSSSGKLANILGKLRQPILQQCWSMNVARHEHETWR